MSHFHSFFLHFLPLFATDRATAFIARWSTASPSERANSQLFLSELCDLLDVPRPSPARDHG